MTANFGAVGGGYGNLAGGFAATVAAASKMPVPSLPATKGGGSGNLASSGYSTVGGGSGNTANGYQATVGGGSANVARGDYATVPGGAGNSARGSYSLAAGQYAQTTHSGTFIWGDGSQILSRAPTRTMLSTCSPRAGCFSTTAPTASAS